MASLSSFLPSSGSASKPSGLRVFTVSKNATDWKPISKPTPTPAKITPTEAVSTKAVKITPTQKKLSPNQLQSFVKPYAEQAKQIGSKIQKAMPLTTQTINDIKTNKPFNIKQNQAENRQIAKQVFDDLKASFNDYMTKGISSEQKGISTGEKVIRKAETLVAGGKTAVKAFSGTFEILSNTPYIGKVIKAFSIPFAALEDSKVADKISNKTVDSLPVSNSVKNRIRPVVTDAVTLASQIALGHFLNVATKKAIKVSEKVGVDTFEKLTKNVIEQSGGSRVVNFTPKDVQNINLGKPVYEAELVKQLGLTSSEWKNAVQKGISVDVPAEKIVRIMDKSYWEKIKRVFKVSPTDKTVVDKGVTTPRGNFAGLLPSGEVAPSEVIGKIIQAGKENTAEGKAFIKAAVDAQKNGQTMTIEEQKTPIKDEQYIKDYRANYAKDLLNADDVREVFKSEGYNRVNSADFHDRATEITEKIFQQDLNTLKPGDKYLFTAGASGTGKTRAMSQYPDIKSDIKAGLDSNFSSNRALRRLGEVIDKGADPSIVFVYRDPIEAWDNGVLRRAANPDNRRVVPAPIFIDNLTDSPKKVLEAHNKYGDKVKIQVLDNSREIGKATLIENPIDYLKKIVYNVEDVKAHVIESTQNALKSGKISEATAKALLGEYSQKDSNISQSGKLEERGSSLDSEADKSLLESDLAKEADAEIMRPKVEKVNAKIQKIEEDLQMRRSDNEVKKYKNAEDFIQKLDKKELQKRVASSKNVEEFLKNFSKELNSATFDEVNKNLPQEAISPEIKLIRQKVSKQDFLNVVEKFMPQVKEYLNIHSVQDYLKKTDPEEVAISLENDRIVHDAFRRLLGKDPIAQDVYISDIVDQYYKNTLPESISKESFSVKNKQIENVPLGRKSKFYETSIAPNIKSIQKIYKNATARITKANSKQVIQARKELYLAWSTDKNISQILSLKPTELNKKIRQLTGANIDGVNIQKNLNQSVPEQFKWTGITNSNWISKQTIDPKDLDKVVASVDISKVNARWNSVDGNSLRQYIVNTFLSIDTRLSYDDLNFNIKSLEGALGQYQNKNLLITIDQGSQNTVAHEIGHYLDHRFAREIGIGQNALSEGGFNLSYIKDRHNLSQEHIDWVNNYIDFADNLKDKSETGHNIRRSEYLNTPTEVFARFVAKFVDWTASKSGYHHSELDYYSDRFTVQDFHNFVKLLQQKAEIDTKYKIKPIVKPTGEAISASEKLSELDKAKQKLAQLYNELTTQQEADATLLSSEQAVEATIKATPKTEKIRQEMQKIQEDIQMRRQDNEVKKSILDQFSTREIQAMRMIKRAIISRENKGRDPITVEETQVYKDNIRDVMAAIGTNSTDEAIRYIREDLPDPIVNASSRAELEQIKVLKSHLTPKEVEVPRSQIPVGTGKEKVSRLEARMKTELDKLTQDKIDELGLTTYKELNLKENRQKAAQYVTDNPTDALKVLKGEIEAPQGILKNNILWAMMQEAKGDMNLAIKLASIEATRFGQELVALRGIDPHNPIRLLNEVVRFREKQFEKRYGKKPVTQVREKIVRNIKDKVKKPDRYDWNSFINSIQC